jgi:hypothetical protein
MEDPGAVPANNFRKRTLVFRASLPRQFEIGGLFVTVGQKRSLWSAPAERSGDGALDEIIPLRLCRSPTKLERV